MITKQKWLEAWYRELMETYVSGTGPGIGGGQIDKIMLTQKYLLAKLKRNNLSSKELVAKEVTLEKKSKQGSRRRKMLE